MGISGQPKTYEMASVLFMDIVRYSLQPIDHQTDLLSLLQDIVRESAEFQRARSTDELVSLPTGDGMALVFLRDPLSPVKCALEIARSLQGHPEIKLRMGIHTGPVCRHADIKEEINIVGGGINMAQRVMDLGDSGHILLSRNMADVLHQLSDWRDCLMDLGEQEVKHGTLMHLYNLCKDGLGNVSIPQKARPLVRKSISRAEVRTYHPTVSVLAIVSIVLVALGVFFFFQAGHRTHLTDKDVLVIADFTNTTGDPVFDEALRQGLAVQLEQSPFLSFVSDLRIQQTLRLMNRPIETRLTPKIAMEVCQRTRSAVVLNGSIAQVGNQYELILKAIGCVTGELLASTQALASNKNSVLSALGKVSGEIRKKLGESLSTVGRYDTPVEQATTPSLDALQAYSLGRKTMTEENDPRAAMPFFQRAIRLDPNFAMAIARLGRSYSIIGETSLAAETMKRAYEVREHVSDHERFYIESHYHDVVTGDLNQARQAYELWAKTYPRDTTPYHNLPNVYSNLGLHEKALEEALRALESFPESAQSYSILVYHYLNLNRLKEAQTIAEEAQAKNLDSAALRGSMYQMFFLQSDAIGMARQVAWATGKPSIEDVLFAAEADTEAYFGRLKHARELSRRAVASAERAGARENAARWEATAALREALFGNATEATRRAEVAQRISTGRSVESISVLALALANDRVRAQARVGDLARRFPNDTVVQYEALPAIYAHLALNQHDTTAAIDALQPASAYELGVPDYFVPLYSTYVRGETFLAAHKGVEAAFEFRKLLDHRALVANNSIGALAHFGLSRAFALAGENEKARTECQTFLTLWKEADPEIPILKEAKAQCAKL